MNVISIVGQPKPEDDWLHRFRNLGEEVYVRLRDTCAVDIHEIDAAVDVFYVREVPPERTGAVAELLRQLIREHHLDDSVLVTPGDVERARCIVVVVVDPAFGERLWKIAARRDLWTVDSDVNRAVVKELRETRESARGWSSLSIWSPGLKDWTAQLDTLELHHGEYSSDPPLDALSVYGATLTPEVAAALREHGYGDLGPTALGFVAFR
jgi:hypothetical protein